MDISNSVASYEASDSSSCLVPFVASRFVKARPAKHVLPVVLKLRRTRRSLC